MTESMDRISELDTELVDIISSFTILTPLSWPKEAMRKFMKGAEKGNLSLPKISYEKVDYSDKISALTNFLKKLGKDDHPAIAFLRDTAESYLDSYYILQGAGTKDVSEFSRKLYGSPKDVLEGYKRSNVDIARYFLRVVESYKLTVSDEPLIYSAKKFRKALARRVAININQKVDPISIIIDKDITARAAAGSNYVKIRKGARFSSNDLDQLYHHELMIHTLTSINGRKQQLLKTLGYSAPRTTTTQEGLAVFA